MPLGGYGAPDPREPQQVDRDRPRPLDEQWDPTDRMRADPPKRGPPRPSHPPVAMASRSRFGVAGAERQWHHSIVGAMAVELAAPHHRHQDVRRLLRVVLLVAAASNIYRGGLTPLTRWPVLSGGAGRHFAYAPGAPTTREGSASSGGGGQWTPRTPCNPRSTGGRSTRSGRPTR